MVVSNSEREDSPSELTASAAGIQSAMPYAFQDDMGRESVQLILFPRLESRVGQTVESARHVMRRGKT